MTVRLHPMHGLTALLLAAVLSGCAPTPDGADGATGEEARSRTRAGEREKQRVRDLDTFDSADTFTLQLRNRQPIHFLGVPMRQIPTDNWLMSELIYEIEPDFLIETGTLHGGSALYYAALLELINPRGMIITVDIDAEQIAAAARDHRLWKERVRFIHGGSTDEEVIAQIEDLVGEDHEVLVTLDTLHAPEHVRRELELYSRFVSPGSYVIVQDTYYEGLPAAIDDFLEQHPEFRKDTKLDDRYIFTKYRGGFLRREAGP